MKHSHFQIAWVAAAALVTATVAFGREPPAAGDAEAILLHLGDQVQALPDSPEALAENLDALQTAVSNMVSELDAARRSEADAHARMASWTGAILSRELKKVSASKRLIELTEKTGRTEEVARYRERHQRLLDTISNTTDQYESIVRHLASLESDMVASGFDQYQQHLVGEELASQIGIHRVVRKHVEEFAQSGTIDRKAWQNELQSR